VFLGSIVCTIVGVIVLSFVARIRNISCQFEDNSSCPEDVIAELSQYMGTPFFENKYQQSIAKIQGALPEISEINVKKHFPSGVKIVLITRDFSYYIISVRGEKYLVTEKGTIIAAASVENLLGITIEGSQDYRAGDSIGEERAVQLEEIARFVLGTPAFKAVRVANDNEIIIVFEGEKQAILKFDDLKRQLSTLQVILHDSTMEIQGKTIDVRFANPIVR